MTPAEQAYVRNLEARLRVAQEEETKLRDRIADLEHTIQHHRRLRRRTETMLAQEKAQSTAMQVRLIAMDSDTMPQGPASLPIPPAARPAAATRSPPR